MPESANALQWRGQVGHYEVYYLTLTDPVTRVGFWIRYTMLAPLSSREPPSAALWFLAMDPREGRRRVMGAKQVLPIEALSYDGAPFSLRVGDAELTEQGMNGALGDYAWALSWRSADGAHEHVHPLLRRARLAKTVLLLPQGELEISGTITAEDERFEIREAGGGQAHLWGSKHAGSWAWVHCNDFVDQRGEPVGETMLDAVSVVVPRAGRQIGPSTPVVGRIRGRRVAATSPRQVLAAPSTFGLTGWSFETVDGDLRLVVEVDAERDQLAGVTYHDPDGELAYCYNSETASLRLSVFEKAPQLGGWKHRETLRAPGRAHFEYAQRSPVEGVALLTS